MNEQKLVRGMGDYFRAFLACVATTLLTLPLYGVVDAANIVMIYLLVVVVVAVWIGSGPAILAAFGGVALFDFFFVEPRFSMAVADGQYLITFAVMLVVALVIGQLAARLREKALLASRREDETRALYGMAKLLAGAVGAEQVADIVRDFLGARLGIEAVLYLPGEDDTLRAIPPRPAGEGQQAHVRAVHEQGQPMYLAAEESGFRPALALPLASPVRTRGVLLVFAEHAEQVCAAERRPLLDAVASLAAIAVERLHYGDVLQQVTVGMESERLRSALLSAVSHDLRTPLTVLVGLADALSLTRPGLPPPAQESALAIRDQALRLSAMVHKLLDMARLQTGKVVLNKEWQPLEEVVGSSLKAMAEVLAGRELRLDLAADLPPLEFDAVLLERVFCNLLENAAKYAPQGEITIAARVAGEFVEVSVADAGPGLPADSAQSVFELFQRGRHDGAVAGVGLGLAICRAIVEVHGGRIRAEQRAEGGTRMVFTLPRGTPPLLEEDTGE
jgi:two-component system sensor histidine kinase KdpD